MVINESNIMWRDSNGFVRKWIDQKTGDVMESNVVQTGTVSDILNEYLHDCEMTSLCCGAGSHEYVEGMCGACNEMVTFECIDCTDNEYEYPTTAEINEMRAEYLKEKDIQYVDNERETLLGHADYLKKRSREI